MTETKHQRLASRLHTALHGLEDSVYRLRLSGHGFATQAAFRMA